MQLNSFLTIYKERVLFRKEQDSFFEVKSELCD